MLAKWMATKLAPNHKLELGLGRICIAVAITAWIVGRKRSLPGAGGTYMRGWGIEHKPAPQFWILDACGTAKLYLGASGMPIHQFHPSQATLN